MKKIIFLAIASAFAATSAQAQVYVEGSYYLSKFGGDHGLGSDPKINAITATVGYGLHPNFAVEGMLGFGAGSSKVNSIAFKQKSNLGFYLKPRYQVTEALEIFARLGYVDTKMSFDGVAENEASPAMGFGANYAINKNVYATGSYAQTHSKDGSKINGLTLGVGYRF